MTKYNIPNKQYGFREKISTKDALLALTVEKNIPQGTILGPTLFNIYLNGIFSIANRGDIVGISDDTAIFYEDDTWQNLRSIVEAYFPL